MFCETAKTSNALAHCRIFRTELAEVGSAGNEWTMLIPGGQNLHAPSLTSVN